ncbi:aldo/keto reductase [Allobaculum sp. JKK-2023]|uniref:aldo/keto reductase n=1 Tax=Allobaculum sp. JKK-2023 TaxID=3108943 RepID=UPI002B05E088|nr:aldo/keto reductase [Allobaculum sp. JKK-2023]
MEYVTLNNGVKMPMEGFGVFQVPDPTQCEQAVIDALEAGYRLIDTAAAYMNEEAVGRAIKKSGVDRKDIFLTTKLWVQDASYEGAKKAIQTSLKKLDTDYIDLLLIHQPMGDIYGAWRAMEEAYHAGILKAIGVSNFYPARLADFCLTVDVQPVVDQVELHPFFQQPQALETMKKYHVQPEAWGPFAEGKFGIFANPVLTKIAQSHNKSVGQVILRWNIQRGVVVIPKSVHKERIIENFNIWDFELTPEEMKEIASLDLGKSNIVDHDSPEFAEMLHGLKVHD